MNSTKVMAYGPNGFCNYYELNVLPAGNSWEAPDPIFGSQYSFGDVEITGLAFDADADYCATTTTNGELLMYYPGKMNVFYKEKFAGVSFKSMKMH